jgi:uncharacterized protein YecT (DUF1311 family)
MNKIKLLFFLLLIGFSSYSQENKIIQKLDTEEQKCLDDGQTSMLICSYTYYEKMDESLNTTYKKIRANLSKAEQEKLKKAQLLWLKKRDQYFKKVESETAEKLDGDRSSQDYRMICAHENALFVKNRIILLEKTYSKKQ